MFIFCVCCLFFMGLPLLGFFICPWLALSRCPKLPSSPLKATEKKLRFCAVIPARNEASVIGNVVDSLLAQNYPKDKLDVYVVPNNCTDDTEDVARQHGAKIFHCEKPVHMKGDALEQFFDTTLAENDTYDAFLIFDADNIADPDFISEMNKACVSGVNIAQGYKGSKNPKESWISGCQSAFFLAWNCFYYAKLKSHTLSPLITGSGFMVTADLLRDIGFHTIFISEDYDFSSQCILRGYAIEYIPSAHFYEEQPVSFSASWAQRRRWASGSLQCLRLYGKRLCVVTKKELRPGCVVSLMPLWMSSFYTYVLVYVFLWFIFSFVCGWIYASLGRILLVWGIVFFLYVLLSLSSTIFLVKGSRHRLSDFHKGTYMSCWLYLFSWFLVSFVSFVFPIKVWKPVARSKRSGV